MNVSKFSKKTIAKNTAKGAFRMAAIATVFLGSAMAAQSARYMVGGMERHSASMNCRINFTDGTNVTFATASAKQKGAWEYARPQDALIACATAMATLDASTVHSVQMNGNVIRDRTVTNMGVQGTDAVRDAASLKEARESIVYNTVEVEAIYGRRTDKITKASDYGWMGYYAAQRAGQQAYAVGSDVVNGRYALTVGFTKK